MSTPTPSASASARRRRSFDVALIVLFLAAIVAPTIDALVRPLAERTPAAREFRSPTPFPESPRNLPEAMRWPQSFETWFDDCAGLRDRLLRARGIVLGLWFGVSPTPSADLTSDGWMFYRGDLSREAFSGELEFGEPRMQAWLRALRSRRDACRELGAKYLFVIGPNKETIYPDHVPRGWTKSGPTPFEQMRAYLAREEPGLFLDLVPAFEAARAQDRPAEREFLYFPLGTHWLPRGDHLAYARIVETLRGELPALGEPDAFDDLVHSPVAGFGDSWAYRGYLEQELTQPVYAVFSPRRIEFPFGTYGDGRRRVVAVGPDASRPSAVLFHDSFGQVVHGLLAGHLARLSCNWGSEFDLGFVRNAKPDVVIELFVERVFAVVPPESFVVAPEALSAPPPSDAFEPLIELRRETALTEAHAGPGMSMREPSGVTGVLRLKLERPDGYLVLPPLPATETRELRVRLAIDVPGDTQLSFVPMRAGETEATRRNPNPVRLTKGYNEIDIRLPRHPRLERLALRPGHIPGRYLIRSLEILGVR